MNDTAKLPPAALLEERLAPTSLPISKGEFVLPGKLAAEKDATVKK